MVQHYSYSHRSLYSAGESNPKSFSKKKNGKRPLSNKDNFQTCKPWKIRVKFLDRSRSIDHKKLHKICFWGFSQKAAKSNAGT